MLTKKLIARGTALVLGCLIVTAGWADDRDLFRSAASDPYVFILFDTSGSMHWQQDNGFALTSADDPTSKLYQAKSALYQVLRGLENSNTRLGWAHFAQSDLEIDRKHYAYRRKAGEPNPPWFGYLPYPAVGQPEHFGRPTYVDGNNRFWLGSCDNPAQGLDNAYYWPKLGDNGGDTSIASVRHNGQDYAFRWRLASGTYGATEMQVRVEAWRENGCGYNKLGDVTLTYEAVVRVDPDGVEIRDRDGVLPSDFIARTEGGLIPGNRTGFLNGITMDSPCNLATRWQPNYTDSTGAFPLSDASQLQYPTRDVPSDRYGSNGVCSAADQALSRGSVVPWDWVRHPTASPEVGFELSTREELMCRLAPNTCSTDPKEYHVVTSADKAAGRYAEFDVGDRVPDFRVARYFENTISNGRLPLKSLYEDYPPIAAFSATPLAGMMEELREWIDFWQPCAEDSARGDRNFGCRQRFAIVLTDGAETCNTAESGGRNTALRNAANQLRAAGVRTFVVGFGGGVTAAQLEDIADFGGTGVLDLPIGTAAETTDTEDDNTRDCALQFPDDPENCRGPILASNKQELIDALTNLFEVTAGESASFASAAVPAGQADAQDSIFLTNFVPIDDRSLWAGELSHFLRPLPLKDVTIDGETVKVPDDGLRCNSSRKSSCLAWKVTDSMLGRFGAFDQVPSLDPTTLPALMDNTEYKLGNAPDQRRVYFGRGLERSGSQIGYKPPLLSSDAESEEDLVSLLIDGGILDPAALLSTTEPIFGDLVEDVVDLLDGTTGLLDGLVDTLETTLALTYSERVEPNPLDEGATEIRYINGDTFHSDPQQLGEPSNVDYLQGNLPVGSSSDCDDLTSKSYKCFFLRNQFRRKVVMSGANDGQFHAYDAGTFVSKVVDERQIGEFDLGTGQELFSFVPNVMVRRVFEMATSNAHAYGVDGEFRLADVFIDPKHDGTPSNDDRMWRTVVMSGLREGGETVEELGGYSSYFMLDLTQPDHLKKEPDLPIAEGGAWIPDHNNYVPSCISNYSEAKCGPIPYASVLWEFSDLDPDNGYLPADEDNGGTGNGFADLAPTWSRPTIGRIRIETTSGVEEDRYVAIFGGGFDPFNSQRGNWLYVLDVETGKPLAKRQLDGAAPSAPAAVDTDGDAYLDTVYIGTVLGNLYKFDLADMAKLTNTGRVRTTDWPALKVFSAGTDYPMFTPPSVIYVPSADRFAVSFGVGNRADLWDESAKDTYGRFYTLLDTGWGDSMGFNAFDESDYEIIEANDTTDRDDLIENPPVGKEPGWILKLAKAEKLVARPFTIAGVTVFSTYNPLPLQIAGGSNVACERDGGTNIYTVFTTSGNALLSDRFRGVPGIVSNPFTEVSALQGRGAFGQYGDPDDEGGGTGGVPGGTGTTDPCTNMDDVRNAIIDLFPNDCRFNEVSINLKVVRSDTGIECVAPVPVCVQATNWKDIP